MLTPQSLVEHLLSRGLLSSKDVTSAGLRIVSRRRKNRNFEVATSHRLGYFAKQIRSTGSLDAEARLYVAVDATRPRQSIRHYLPRFYDFSATDEILLLQLIKPADSIDTILAERCRIGGRLASELGKAVAAAHDATIQRPNLPESDVPWVSSLPAPPIEFLSDISEANLLLLQIVQRSLSLCRCLKRIEAEWRPLSVIHGDLRLANCLVSRRKKGIADLKIVDWEMCGFGEPSWDVGCIFAGFLSSWIASMPAHPDSSAGRLMRSARVPLERLKPAIARFWIAYATERRLAGHRRRRFLLQSIRFAAARLVQTAYEQMQHTARMTATGVVLLQLAANIATNPHQAGRTLLGLDVSQ